MALGFADDTAVHAVAITPSDSNGIGGPCMRILVGGAGTISLVTEGGETVSLTVVAGQELKLRATKVNATGTTATGLVRLW